MTYLLNSEHDFREEMLAGLTAAYGRYLRRIPFASAVASVSAPQAGRVSTIIGGGSGHYPAFAGLVGPGLADAAVCGDIFASPSAEQVRRTILAVHGGAGVILMFGNYQGDIMHFGLAADHVRAQYGIDARIVLVTDDIASAPVGDTGRRRGIAGGFFVFRAASAAAHRGASLDAVEAVARRANDATRTIGVAFGGCTVPGQSEPLFTVAPGSVEVGLGIHGEPGILTVPRAGARELAGMLVERLLSERPSASCRARILVNGLGRLKYEEMFVLYLSVAEKLGKAGIELSEPEIGEFVTSLDMAGCSVTLAWTDDELEDLLSAPAAAPGYVRPGAVARLDTEPAPLRVMTATVVEKTGIPDERMTGSGRLARGALTAMAARLHEIESHLGKLDAVAGDGDHGAGMTRGMDAAVAAGAATGPDAAAVLDAAGMAFADAAGGASGALWGSALTAVGAHLRAADADCPPVSVVAASFERALQSVIRLGGAHPGDKTMLDALEPFTRTLAAAARSGAKLPDCFSAAAAAAREGAAATAEMTARRGRAAWLPERSTGAPDPGAVSMSECLNAAAEVLAGWPQNQERDH